MGWQGLNFAPGLDHLADLYRAEYADRRAREAQAQALQQQEFQNQLAGEEAAYKYGSQNKYAEGGVPLEALGVDPAIFQEQYQAPPMSPEAPPEAVAAQAAMQKRPNSPKLSDEDEAIKRLVQPFVDSGRPVPHMVLRQINEYREAKAKAASSRDYMAELAARQAAEAKLLQDRLDAQAAEAEKDRKARADLADKNNKARKDLVAQRPGNKPNRASVLNSLIQQKTKEADKLIPELPLWDKGQNPLLFMTPEDRKAYDTIKQEIKSYQDELAGIGAPNNRSPKSENGVVRKQISKKRFNEMVEAIAKRDFKGDKKKAAAKVGVQFEAIE